MTIETLATLIHISDLHIGRIKAADQGTLEPFPPWFEGKAGHEPRAAMALQEFFLNDPITKGAHLIFSGDLTAFGEEDQFEEGEELLRELAEGGRERERGVIAGNHDFWQGCYAVFPPNQPWFFRERNRQPDKIFGYQDYVRDFGTIGHGFSLRVVLLNSDSEVWGDDKQDGLRRLLAQGAFVQEIRRADEALSQNPAPARTITVLLMHHSAHYRWTKHLMLQEIEPVTLEALRDFLTKHGISIMLTGHIHNPVLLFNLAQRNEFNSTTCFECRCGTTTQRRPRRELANDRRWHTAVAHLLPPRIKSLFDLDRLGGAIQAGREWPPDNVLLAHRILYKSDSYEVFWLAELYFYDDGNFQPWSESRGAEEDLLHWGEGNGAGSPRCVRVWPRT